MSRIQSRRGTFRSITTLGLVLFVVFLSGCEVLATEGAREAIAGQREVRALEDAALGPLEQEMNDLYVLEIQPRESKIEDLRYQLQVLEEDVLRPLWETQEDQWAPGGDASDAQIRFEAKYRELELLQRSIEIEQRQLDTKWQNLWGAGGNIDPEFKALEDLRFEKQRELDRAYRFGNRPIEDIWNRINELNSSQNWGNNDSQIKSEEINLALQRLYDRFAELQNGEHGEAGLLEEKARAVQNELDALYNHGWDQIYSIRAEIDQLKGEQTGRLITAGRDDSIRALIAELERQKESYVANRDAEVASLEAALAAAEAESSTVAPPTVLSPDNGARIGELEQLIADLEVQSVALLASNLSEIDSYTVQIDETNASFDLQIADAIAASQPLSDGLVSQADQLESQIAQLTEEGGDDSVSQIPALQAQKDALVAQLEAEQATLDEIVRVLTNDAAAAVDELQSFRAVLEAATSNGLTAEIDAQSAAYQAELDELRTSVDETVVLISNSTSSADIQETIRSTEERWNNLINEVDIEILELRAQLGSVTVDDSTSARIHNLELQAAELENALNARIANLEATVNELNRQANNAGSGNSAGLSELQSQIDRLNNQLESIWQHESSNGLDMLKRMQKLEEQARAMERELQEKTRSLEEALWDIDDRLNVFYRNQESGGHQIQVEYEAEMALIQQRRIDIEEQRWAIELEERTVREEIEASRALAIEEIRAIENGQFREIKNQIRNLELELRGFYATVREIEIRMDEAHGLVEDRKRELEDNVLDLLEEAAGVGAGAEIGAFAEGGTNADGGAFTGDHVDTPETGVEFDSTLPELEERAAPDLTPELEELATPDPTAVVTN